MFFNIIPVYYSSFPKQKKLAYTTIMTVMDNLYKKGFVKREKIKKTYYYSSSFEEKNILSQSLINISKNLFSQYGKKAVKEKTGALKTILIDKSTQIRHGFISLNFSDLKKDMHIIVLGEPRQVEGAIIARIIRVIDGSKTRL